MASADWTVGRVAERTGVRVSALHYYESLGLIHSVRTNGNQRRFRADVVRRVSLIRAAQQMGISLEEIRQALDALPNRRTPTAADWERMATAWSQQLQERIDSLQRLRDRLTGCIGCGCLSMERCPLYNPEDKLGKEGPGAVLLDRD